jgi:hypothetical protein
MLKKKCCLYVIISIRFISITICNLLIELPSYMVLHKEVQTLIQLAAAVIWKWCGKVCLVKTKSTASMAHWCDWTLCTEPVFDSVQDIKKKKNLHIIAGLFSSFRPFCWTHNTGHHVCPPVTTQRATICPAVKSMLGSFRKICQ